MFFCCPTISNSRLVLLPARWTQVGVVMLQERAATGELEVLLAQRGKDPNKGKWSFPGGGLELGETMAECAAREVRT